MRVKIMKAFTLLAHLLGVACARAEPANEIRSAFVRDSQIWVAHYDGAEAHRITEDDRPKHLPVWSPNGEIVAFVRESTAASLSDLVVVNRSGAVSMKHPFRPMAGRSSGMRFIESLSWLSDSSLLVGGSVDPSTVEYSIVDIRSGQETGGYLADGFSLKVSPDGKHVAYQGYIPHFTPEESRGAQFCIDHECDFDRPWSGYPGAQGRRFAFISEIVWSPDGTSVAAVEQDRETNEPSVVVRRMHGEASTYPLPLRRVVPVRLKWNAGSSELVAEAVSGSWRISLASGSVVAEPHSSAAEAEQTRQLLRKQLGDRGNLQADFWCQGCPLESLPRRNGPDEER